MRVVLLVTLPLPACYPSCDTLVTTAVEAPSELFFGTGNTAVAVRYC
jgi:hypothetical protein